MFSCWKWKISFSKRKNIIVNGIIACCISVLVIYQFAFGTLIALNNRSINQLIYESFLTDAAKTTLIQHNITAKKNYHNNHTKYENSASNIYNQAINKTKNIQLLFADQKLWFQEKVGKYSMDLHLLKSENTKETKRILVWTTDFYGNIGYFPFQNNIKSMLRKDNYFWKNTISNMNLFIF